MKKIGKILKKIVIIVLVVLIIIAIVVAGLMIKNHFDSLKPALTDDYYTEFRSDSPLEKKYAGLGSYEVANADYAAEDKAIDKYRIWYPKELESKDEKYPVILVVNASNVAALNYEPFFRRLASWGFIVAGNEDRQAGKGNSTAATLDFVLEQSRDSGSIFYQKVSDKIGCVGYSQGGAGAIRAVTEFDNSSRYSALYTGSAAYPFLAKNMGWEYDASKIDIPYMMTASTGKTDDAGVEDIYKEYGGVCPLKALEETYHAMGDTFKIRARVKEAEHEDMLKRSDGYMTAWMLWQLKDDAEASAALMGESAEILSNHGWQDLEKNF